jgi:hypothetical protein
MALTLSPSAAMYVDSKASWDAIGEDGATRYPERGEPLPLNRVD